MIKINTNFRERQDMLSKHMNEWMNEYLDFTNNKGKNKNYNCYQ
jgi:hypothetical protein